ncbi:hypothetical protein ACFQX6_18100 [Streptosporangium lutulentum]
MSSGEEAKLGTVTARFEHYVPWRDPYPLTREQLAMERGKTPAQLSSRRSWRRPCSTPAGCSTSSTTT